MGSEGAQQYVSVVDQLKPSVDSPSFLSRVVYSQQAAYSRPDPMETYRQCELAGTIVPFTAVAEDFDPRGSSVSYERDAAELQYILHATPTLHTVGI